MTRDFRHSDRPHRLCRAARIFFWLAIIAAALLAVHVVAVLVCRFKGLPRPPRALEVPRIELWVALAVLQPFSQACGRALLHPRRLQPSLEQSCPWSLRPWIDSVHCCS